MKTNWIDKRDFAYAYNIKPDYLEYLQHKKHPFIKGGMVNRRAIIKRHALMLNVYEKAQLNYYMITECINDYQQATKLAKFYNHRATDGQIGSFNEFLKSSLFRSFEGSILAYNIPKRVRQYYNWSCRYVEEHNLTLGDLDG